MYSKTIPNDIYEMLENTVREVYNKEALVQGDRRYKYDTLYQHVNAVSNKLEDQYGIKHGHRVGICMGNAIEYVVLMFACLKLGAIVLPLNVRLHVQELQYIIDHAEPSLLLLDEEDVTQEVFETLKEMSITENIQKVALLEEKQIERQEPVSLSPNDGAFLIYTSGTTGKPKGALLSHHSVIHSVLNYEEVFGTTQSTSTLIAVPLFHVTGLIGQLLHIVRVGGKSVLLKKHQTKKFINTVKSERIQFLFNVPTIYKMVTSTMDKENRAPVNDVRIIASGGAPLHEELIDDLMEKFPNAHLHNTYGATETSSPTTIMPKSFVEIKKNSVGKPVNGAVVKVMSDKGEERKSGEIGELWIKGTMLMKGYWRNEEANHSNFVDGFWKSGDYAYIDNDGFVYIKDRKKDSINRGGEKIYSIEVEDVINQHPSIYESAVKGIPDPIYGEKIIAFVILEEKVDTINIDELKTFIGNQIAHFKVPENVSIVEKLPKNPGGKIMKQYLE